MANKKPDAKKVQSYRLPLSLLAKAKKKAEKQKTTLCMKVEQMVTDWVEN